MTPSGEPPRRAAETIRPIRPTQNLPQRSPSAPNVSGKRKTKSSIFRKPSSEALYHYLLGFAIGLLIFGIAAVVVCVLIISNLGVLVA